MRAVLVFLTDTVIPQVTIRQMPDVLVLDRMDIPRSLRRPQPGSLSERQFVGVDLHLHRSVICRIDERNQQLECVQIDNDPKALVKAVRAAGRVRRSRSRRRMAGTGWSMRCRRPGSRCIWRIRTG